MLKRWAALTIMLATAAAIFAPSVRAQTDYSLFDPLVDVCELIQRFYVRETDNEELVAAAINGMLHQLDPYSEYIPPRSIADFQMRTSGAYEGIGVSIDIQAGQLMVISPFEDSPAHRAGIRAGDVILEVDGESTEGWSSTQATQAMTGPAGSDVTLRLRRPDGAEKVVNITRGEILVPTVRGWRRHRVDGRWDYMLDRDAGIGFLRIAQFNEDTLAEFDRAVAAMQDTGLQALVLDLRSNPGGLMSTAVEIVDRLIDRGAIVSTRGARSPEQFQTARAEGTYPRFHLVVMIDQGSASGAEVVAGALQDHGRAVVVGERSWGKGSVQRIIHLPDSGAAVKLTTDYYYLPNGRCVHRLPGAEVWGVDPDVEQKLDPANFTPLRALLEELTAPVNPLDDEDAELPTGPLTDADTAAQATDAALARRQQRRLLELDGQLDQAVKLCRGLLRTQPSLASVAETLTP